MATTPTRIATGQLPAASAALYTATNVRAQIVAASITNPSAGARLYTFWIVPSAASATDANIVYDAESIGIQEGLTLDRLIGHMLNPGDSIHGLADAATSVTYHLSASVFTS